MRRPRPSTLVWRSFEGRLVILVVVVAVEEVVEEETSSVEMEPMNDGT